MRCGKIGSRTSSNLVTATKQIIMNSTSYSIHQEHRNNALKALEKAKQLEAERLSTDRRLKQNINDKKEL